MTSPRPDSFLESAVQVIVVTYRVQGLLTVTCSWPLKFYLAIA